MMDKDITPKAAYQLSRDEFIEIGDELFKTIALIHFVSVVSFLSSALFKAVEEIDNDFKVNKNEF